MQSTVKIYIFFLHYKISIMNPEIENLIEMSLADGVVTEKERAIIIRKAEALGEDKDEIEMILDAKIALMEKEQIKIQHTTSSNSNKEGKIKKCPSCGAPAKSMDIICSECGHEYRNKEANKSIQNLIEKLNVEDNNHYKLNLHRAKKKANIITQFPIPQNKEDILEFMSYGIPILDSTGIEDCLAEAWLTKVQQAIIKAKMTTKGSVDIELINEYEKKVERIIKKRKNGVTLSYFLIPIVSLSMLYLVVSAIASLFGAEFWPFN